jgi:hypothetical protein
MHLSPYEQQIIAPWLRTFPRKIVQRAPHYIWPLGMVGTVIGIQMWADAAYHAENYKHRF